MKISEIDPARLDDLNRGRAEATELTECLAVDFPLLLASVLPDIARAEAAEVEALRGQGISRRMARMGAILDRNLGDAQLAEVGSHLSDTVRGWTCFALAARNDGDLVAVLGAMRPFADDAHFGVREWAWLAARPAIACDIAAAINRLAAWASDPSERIRRFASEATRPRGVWCPHIPTLKDEPAIGLPVLEPLRADPARYVQDSVGNWLNDAAKSRPDWVRATCVRWTAEDPGPETGRIVKRATRSLDAATGG